MTEITVSIYDLIQWAAILISLMLWWNERKKNDTTKYYMVIQGILQSLKEKIGYYANLTARTNSNDINPDKEQFIMLTNSVYAENKAMMQTLMGVLKSFGLKKDLPFDIEEFLSSKNFQVLEKKVD